MRKGFGVAELVLVALGLIVVATMFQGGKLESVFSFCSWQQDYWWVTCQEVKGPAVVVKNNNWQCPLTADTSRCGITAIGRGAPDIAKECDSCGPISCANCVPLYAGTDIDKGKIVQSIGPDISVQVWRKELRSCGTAACSQSGEVLKGAQGCSWNPVNGEIGSGTGQMPVDPLIDKSKLDPIDTVPVGQSYKYVYSQHLVSCPSECVAGRDDLSCSMPSSLRSGTTAYADTFGSRSVKWYVSGASINIVGCKKTGQVCEVYDDSKTLCFKYRDLGECGTLSVRDAGQCGQNSDCGDTTRYYCDWDTSQLKGTCRLLTPDVIQECQFDYQCQQTPPTCNSRQYGYRACESGKCMNKITPVKCCTSSECQAGYFCNANYICQEAQTQKPECPAGQCCENRNPYRDRTCEDMTNAKQTVCCGSGTSREGECVDTQNDCGGIISVPNPFGFIGDFLKGVANFIIGLGIIIVVIIIGLVVLNITKK